MGVYQRDERWMVYWKENGKRRDKSFGRGDEGRQLAEAFEAAVNDSRVIDGMVIPVQRIEVPEPVQLEPVVVQEPEEVKGITFGQLSQKYLEHLKVSGKTETHILTLAHLLKFSFFDILDKNKPVDSMSYVEEGMKFIKHYQGVSKQTGKPRAQTTVNRYCNYLAAIFNFGIENELSKVNPLSKRKKARERPRDVQLTVKDMKKIMEHAEPHVKWAMEVCFNLGTRPGKSELLALKWSDVDFDKGTVKIYATKTKTFRTVPVRPSFLEKLKVMQANALTAYIIEFKGRKVDSVRKSFNTACELAGITYPIRMYDLRHLFATTLLSQGADLSAVSKLMGHFSVKMTADVYYHYLEGEKERAVNLLPELEGV